MAQVAIFDSGVGGLSIYQNVVLHCPEHDYVFLSDNQAFPYGTKDEIELLDRVQAVVRRLDEHFAIDVLIVACNTASTVVLPHLREEFDFHVIGVVPAIKPAAEMSVTKRIGLLATPATINRPYTNELISKFANDCKVTRIGSSDLVVLAEKKLCGLEIDETEMATILKPITDDADIDAVVLACTHFPLLKSEILAELTRCNHSLQLIDSGEAIANRLLSLGQTYDLPVSRQENRIAIMTDTNVAPTFIIQLENFGFNEVQHLSV